MAHASAVIATDRPSRYLIQLCSHLKRSRAVGHGSGAAEVTYSETEGRIDFGWAQARLAASEGELRVDVESADEVALQRLQDQLAARLQQFSRRDPLVIVWDSTAPTASGVAAIGGQDHLRRLGATCD